jgi:PBP1b-binding outer membrane lipoprotein LpoB
MIVLRVLSIGLAALVASGCLNSTSLVKVKPDGSGTIEQTMLVNLAAIKGMMAGFGGGGQIKESGGILNEEDFKRSAERMGVRPVSLTPIKQGGFEGAKAVYAFDDITKIRVDQDPQMSGASKAGLNASSTPIKFAFAREGGTSRLTITVDEKIAAGAADKAQQAPSLDKIDPAMMQMIKKMFEGFHILIDLEVDGTIVKTNADYVTGSKITLLELDVESILADEAKLTALQSKVRPGASLSELRPYLKDIKGVKVNNPNLTIEYR